MKRTVIAYGNYYNEFVETLNEKEKLKLKYVLSLMETSDRIPLKFINYIRDGLYELRMEYNGNIYRLFFIFDEGQMVVVFNGFQKKSQKTPQSEINKALKIKKEYERYKQSYYNKYKRTT
jgi:phage-related protein